MNVYVITLYPPQEKRPRLNEHVTAEQYEFDSNTQTYVFTVGAEVVYRVARAEVVSIKLMSSKSISPQETSEKDFDPRLAREKLDDQPGQIIDNDSPSVADEVIEICPFNVPDLTFTTILNAAVDNQEISKRTWRRLLEQVLIVTTEKLGGKSWSLRGRVPVDLQIGQVEEKGFVPIEELNISVRYMSANETCATVGELAQKHGIALDITFVWRTNQGSLYPGRTGRLCVDGN